MFWSFSRKDYQKTNWWSKTAGAAIGPMLTIRTANTVRKIVCIQKPMPDSLFAIVMLHLQITQEERYLANTLGTPYHAYCRQVFRYLCRK